MQLLINLGLIVLVVAVFTGLWHLGDRGEYPRLRHRRKR